MSEVPTTTTATVRGIATYQTYLMYKSTESGTYQKLLDITSFPDLIGTPERIDITSLSDAQRVYISGIQDREDMTFNANYTPEQFAAVNDLRGQQLYFAVWFGATGDPGSEVPDGSKGKFSWQGDVVAGVTGGGVNEAVGMTVTCTPSTIIEFDDGN